MQAQHALSVCQNKLGDVRYTQGDLPAAREQYAAALAIRRSLCNFDGRNSPVPARQVRRRCRPLHNQMVCIVWWTNLLSHST